MRVVVFGASGNVGTSTVRALAADKRVDQVVGVVRRPPEPGVLDDVEWHRADVATDDLSGLMRGADAVVHLAWVLNPTRHPGRLQAINVEGSERVFRTVAQSNVQALVYASSVGAYSPGPKEPVDESYPTDGIASASYSRQKAYVERLLDRFELLNEAVRVVRLRPALTFKAEAGHEIRRLFGGRLLPPQLFRDGRLPVVPDIPGLAFQAVHTDDVADAYRRAVTGSMRGVYNIAADPVLTPRVLAEAFGARRVPVPAAAARAGAAFSYRAHLQPSEPGWLDMALQTPLLDTTQARRELEWAPTRSAVDALRELLGALGGEQRLDTPQLSAPADARGTPI